jgi:hypothetical protein
MRQPIFLGQLNDGIETQFAGSDVKEHCKFAQALGCVELDRRLSDQVPSRKNIQGDPGDRTETIGFSLLPGLVTVESVDWPEIVTPYPTDKPVSFKALVVRVNYNGFRMSWISTKRPVEGKPAQRGEFDRRLTALKRNEVDFGYSPTIFIDANEPDPEELAGFLGMSWNAPFADSVVGIFTHFKMNVLAVTSLPKSGEHRPVILVATVPLPAVS